MFIGHFGLGFAAKAIDNRPSLGTLFLASQFIDLLWPLFLLFGIEKVTVAPGDTAFTPLNFVHYPFSHGLVSVFIWAMLFGAVYFVFMKNSRGAILLGLLVMSHWILDLVTHRPDLPLIPWGEAKVGFGLWNSVILTMITEGAIFILGAYLYFKVTRAESRKGTAGLWSLLLFLAIVYLINGFGSPPPSEKAIAVVGMSQWLLIAWAYWLDRNRVRAGEEFM